MTAFAPHQTALFVPEVGAEIACVQALTIDAYERRAITVREKYAYAGTAIALAAYRKGP
ncbi:unnamed protein product [Strongylus vulgaris]|uniref:Uncharacterized protein n=1 Tax=Strongylus vulgaris TaxID=40348 RepID=A0A3P7I1P0_STRVU|nr:unnamed protein product [Strongylus vulgaris]